MKRLLIDSSQVLKRDLWAAVKAENSYTVEFEGKEHRIPSAMDGYEIALGNIQRALKDLKLHPINIVLVKDGKRCKEERREIFSGYCASRGNRPLDFSKEFYNMQDMIESTLLSYGALSVTAEGKEADDIIYFLSEKVDAVVMSGDSDLLQCNSPVYNKGVFNEDKFFGIAKKFIPVYKALVGDKADGLTSAKGFGDGAFVKMLAKYGDDVLDEIFEMLENETLEELEEFADEFKPFSRILESKEDVYACYKCAKPIHPGWDLEWKAAYPKGDGALREYEPVVEVVVQDSLSDTFLDVLRREIKESPYVALDVESYTTEQGKKWMEDNKSSNGKKPLDVYGQILTGFSLTLGRNQELTYYFPILHKDTDNISKEDVVTILNQLDESVPTVVQNCSFELPVIRKYCELRFDRGWLPQNLIDTKILANYVAEWDLSGLKYNSKKWLGYDQITYEEVVGDKEGMHELTGAEVLQYGSDDTICTSALLRIYELIMKYEETWNCYIEADQSIHHLYAESFLTGVKFDLDKNKELQEENTKVLAEKMSEIEGYLIDLEWEEYVKSAPATEVRITFQNMHEVAAQQKKQKAEAATVVKKRWPGVIFEPATELNPAEIKRLYEIYTGLPLSCRVRLLDKVADVIEETGEYAFAEFVRNEDLENLNELVADNFTPAPKINLRSNKDLTKLLYKVYNFPVRVRGKVSDVMRAKGQREGNPSANDDALAHCIAYDCDETQKKLVEAIVAAKSCLTEDSLFYRPYFNMPHYEDGFVHPQGGQCKTKSGRAASSGPNFSQISRQSRVREVYVPLEEDHVWVSFDVEGQELIHCAVQSQCPDMLACYTGEVRDDLHSRTGVYIYNILYEADMTYEEFMQIKSDDSHQLHKKVKECRYLAKPVSFLDLYQGTSYALAIDLRIKEELAQQFLDAKGAAFPGVRTWQASQTAIHEELGYAVTPLGKRRHLQLNGSYTDSHELKGGLNHIIQGGAAIQLKLIMREIWRRRILEKFQSYLMFSVYDEINLSVRKSQAIELIKAVHPLMTQQFLDFPIDFKSSIEIGRSFGELTNIGVEVDEGRIKEILEEV